MSESDFSVDGYRLSNGEVLPRLRLHYHTLGTLELDQAGHATNAVLLLHGTIGSSAQFLKPAFSKAMFGPGQPLDTDRYFVVIPDALGHGASSKPSDGMQSRFPQYGYSDLVQSTFLLVTQSLGVDHLKLVLGTSMGGMQTWMWGEEHPAMMDALIPVACQPAPVTGRNWMWRSMILNAIRRDPAWNHGLYRERPALWSLAWALFELMTQSAGSLQAKAPTRDAGEELVQAIASEAARTQDANDVLYEFEASFDYQPEDKLELIVAKLFAINFADDLLNPPELSELQQAMSRLRNGDFILIPPSAGTHGHSTLNDPKIWGHHVLSVLNSLQH